MEQRMGRLRGAQNQAAGLGSLLAAQAHIHREFISAGRSMNSPYTSCVQGYASRLPLPYLVWMRDDFGAKDEAQLLCLIRLAGACCGLISHCCRCMHLGTCRQGRRSVPRASGLHETPALRSINATSAQGIASN